MKSNITGVFLALSSTDVQSDWKPKYTFLDYVCSDGLETIVLSDGVNISLFCIEGEFEVVPTDKICGLSLSSKIPVDMNSIFMKLYVIPQKF